MTRAPRLPFQLPKFIGHRGIRGLAPENTLCGFKVAKDYGFTWFEFDVKLSQCGVPLLFHDDELSRTTNGIGLVRETPWKTLQRLDAGGWFKPEFVRCSIPTLEQALRFCEQHAIGVNIEIKPNFTENPETAEAICDLLSKGNYSIPILISSFCLSSLEVCATKMPNIPRSLLTEEYLANPERLHQLIKLLNCVSLNIDHRVIHQELLQYFALERIPLLAFTVNDRDRADELFQQNIVAVFTDFPLHHHEPTSKELSNASLSDPP